MGGFDEHVSIVGDWMPPSPSPRTLFSSMMGDERSGTESVNENRNGYLLPGPTNVEMMRSSVADDDETIKSNLMSSRGVGGGGLLERMAARAGFNAPRLNTESIRPADTRSPYLTIPPGLSPTSLLDSPVFLTSNSLVQPSPTTGKFSFLPSNIGTSMLMTDKENSYEDVNGSSFAFQPSVMGPAASFTFGSSSKANYSDNSILPQSVKVPSQDSTLFDHSNNSAAKSTHDMSPEPAMEHSPPLDEQQVDDGDQIINGDPNVGSEDGYNWRKYGQKQVKGSEYPRSYYKCTHANCPVKKKVERSHEGHITEIIYKGAHNHPKPPPNRRCAPGGDAQLETTTTEQPGTGNPDWRWENPDEYGNGKSSIQIEPGDGVQGSSTFSNDEDEDDRVTHGSVSLGYDGEGDESESKRRKVETYPPCDISGGATRAIREPRVVVQTTSEVDILDDGYRWRKYGQKVVKGNPNPRSYYKCTSAGCSVRKHVERASHDLKSVITTYEGKHNHDVPAARNSSHLNSHSNSLPTQVSQIHRPEPARFNNNTSLGRSFGSNSNLGFGMNLAMAGFGPGTNQGRLPTHSYFGQPNPMSDAGYMLPKVEPDSDSGLNVYHQIMNRLPM